MRPIVLAIATTSLLRVCRPAQQTPAPGTGTGMAAMIPEHGGAIAVSGGLSAEVIAQPGGRVVAYVRDARRAAVMANELRISVRKPDGELQPVAVTYDHREQAYIGQLGGISPGSYPVQLAVQTTPAAPSVELVTPPLAISGTTAVPAPRYGGNVQIVGDHAVETVVSRTGDVALFWMDLNGNPVPTTDVALRDVQLTVNGQVRTAPVQVEAGHYVAHVPMAAPSSTVAVSVPTVAVRGVVYRHIVVPRQVVVAVVPTAPIVVPPSVLIEHPVPPAVVFNASSPAVFVGRGHVPHGRAVGYWRHHGGFVVGAQAPGVVIAPPSVGVFVQGGGRGRGWGGHGHGHGHGH